MILTPLKPKIALNKAFLKVKPNRNRIEDFKKNLLLLLDQINEAESEEFHKNLVSKFLDTTWYGPNHFINTKGRNDLVIHNGKDAKSTVGVILEAKKPTNKSEMVQINQINTKAFQELVLYYLRERITHKNLELKYLVATNIYEWFIFDAQLFNKLFAENKHLVKQFTDFEEGRMGGKSTDFFYKEIAEPAISAIKSEITFTHFNIKDYEKVLRNADKSDDNKLIALFKIFSPEHLLKLPFTNDSNSLDKVFYTELLHIIGLTETKEGGKKLIERKKEGERNAGSLLENAITQLESLDKINRLDKPGGYGDTIPERLFNVGLELGITWINRILFLKLLEAQLMNYHGGDLSFAFLNTGRVKNYDDLNSLFFSVLAKLPAQRDEEAKKLFAKVPYLNSSLFEPTEIEHATLFISNLRERKLPLLSQTVLKDNNGKKRSGELDSLEYLFEFLNAYDFSSEGSEEIQEENKSLINASVLGLIFEKINGYKDGSFFTPGFITMYMCKETIRRSVVQKFNERKKWNCINFDELYDKIEDRKEANEIINSLKLCDPAVGSGHFLVSGLNEIISIKSDLKILLDREGKRLKEYQIEVVNDELIITDEEGDLFEYHPNNKESRRIQETLFHEKQNIIENCLFGVDINPNSVKICRLRLWIELLKNAYYTAESDYKELETLPNIDINIKCGNSLISRFALDADLKQALKKSKWNIDSYKLAVQTYRNAQNKEEKREMERLIEEIKSNFRTEIDKNDPLQLKLSNKSGELFRLLNQQQMFELSKSEQKILKLKRENIEIEIKELSAQIEEIKTNKIYENAFEWRFEFPEVLNDNGGFVGFDMVIGNPPYIRQEDIKDQKPYLQSNYETYAGTADLYVFFVEKGMKLLREDGYFCYILPNKWMKGGYGKALRKYTSKLETTQIVDFGDLPVFEEATTYPCVWQMRHKKVDQTSFAAAIVDSLQFENGISEYLNTHWKTVTSASLTDESWNLVDDSLQQLICKIKSSGNPLGEYLKGSIFRGVLTGLNEAFVIDTQTKNNIIEIDSHSIDIIKPFLAGRDIKRYQEPNNDRWLICFKNGFTKEKFGKLSEDKALQKMKSNYPGVMSYLEDFETKAKARWDKGEYWWELRPCDYYKEFEKPKILYQEIAAYSTFVYDTKGLFTNNKLFLIPTENKSLLGFLNSKLVWFYLNNSANILRGALALQSPYIIALPFAESLKNNSQIDAL